MPPPNTERVLTFDSSTPMIHAIPAERESYMRVITALMPDVRETRAQVVHTSCSFCRKTDEGAETVTIKKCAKCKGVFYCSRECQKKDWPRHKKSCHTVEGPGIHQQMSSFMSNKLLYGHLGIYCALAFNLTQRLRIDDPLMVTVNVGIEPTDTRTFFKLLQPTYNPDETIRGMFQINTIEKIPEEVEIEANRIAAWKDARAREPPNSQVVLVQFKRSGHSFSWTTTLTIAPISLAIARQRPPLRQNSAIYGESEVPMNEASIIEFINGFIRWDHENRCRLQLDMTKYDIDAIRGLVQEGNQSEAVKDLQAKVNRERIYRLHQVVT